MTLQLHACIEMSPHLYKQDLKVRAGASKSVGLLKCISDLTNGGDDAPIAFVT